MLYETIWELEEEMKDDILGRIINDVFPLYFGSTEEIRLATNLIVPHIEEFGCELIRAWNAAEKERKDGIPD